MTPPLHNLRYRTFCYATEDPSKVLEALSFVVGDVEPETDKASTYHGAPITIYRGGIDDAKLIDEILRGVAGTLGSDLRLELDKRLDEDSQLHLRLDKQAAYDGRYAWARGGDAVAVWGTVEAYPSKKAKAVQAMEGYLDGLEEE